MEKGVAIVGAGGLGSNVAIMLARTGVSPLFIIDFDKVEESNLNRQYYTRNDLGEYKVNALKKHIEEINPNIEVKVYQGKIMPHNIVELLGKYSIVCEALDNPETKAILVNTLLQHSRKIKIVSGSGMGGYESSNLMKTSKKMNQLYVCGDEEAGLDKGYKMLAPRVNICAGHEANMIIRLLNGLDEV